MQNKKASGCAFTQLDAFVLSNVCRIAIDPVTANYVASPVPKIQYRLKRPSIMGYGRLVVFENQ
jgi:hypothetical protein